MMTRLMSGLLVAVAIGGRLAGQPSTTPADLVVVNAKVVTVDPEWRIASGFAVRGGRFSLIGSTSEVRRAIGPDTRVVDAGGRTIVPGLIDTHVHALDVAATEAAQPFVNLTSVADIQSWLRTRVAGAAPGTWIWTPRVFPTRLRERRFPTRQELDAASPTQPVVVDGAYAFVLNTAALGAAAITGATPDPRGGAIVRGTDGQPTGLLRNVGALLDRFRPAASNAVPLDGLEAVHRRYLASGITSVTERGATLDGYRTYEALHRAGRLHLRAGVTIRIPPSAYQSGVEAFVRGLPLRFNEGDDWLKVGPLKIVADGGILIGTSYMREPFGSGARQLYAVDDLSYRGFLTLTREQIAAAFAAGHRLGWQMVAHVTGDAGVDVVLDAIEAAQKAAPAPDRRHTLIHAYFTHAETARRAARLGVLVDTQPAWYFKDADALAGALGADRVAHFIGLRSWRDAGATVAINTDHMFGLDANEAMNPFNPFLTMATAVTRQTESGQRVSAGEAVSREDALRMMTIDAARLGFDERNRGSIEAGKHADFVVLSEDLLECPPDRLRSIRPTMTAVGGQMKYEGRGTKDE